MANFLLFKENTSYYSILYNNKIVSDFRGKQNIFSSLFASQCTIFANNSTVPDIQSYKTNWRLHSVSLGTALPPSKPQTSIFSVHLDTEKLNKSPRSRQKALIILTCCTCLTITLIPITEMPTSTSLIHSYINWFNRTKISQN